MARRYEFRWELLGDLDAGRPNLGRHTRVEVYRLMHFCLRDVLEGEFGTEKADRLFFAAGRLSGLHLYDEQVKGVATLDEFVARVQTVVREFEIGVLRVEDVSPSADRITMTIDEDLDCSGLPDLHYEVCAYDEGFIAGLLEAFTGRVYSVKEIDCWCTGDRTCRYRAEFLAA
jgi:uncharacterized protein